MSDITLSYPAVEVDAVMSPYCLTVCISKYKHVPIRAIENLIVMVYSTHLNYLTVLYSSH